MKNNKLKTSGAMLSFLIIIISFIYAINIQPKVIGDTSSKETLLRINAHENPNNIIQIDGVENPDENLINLGASNPFVNRLFYLHEILHKISAYLINVNNLNALRQLVEFNKG